MSRSSKTEDARVVSRKSEKSGCLPSLPTPLSRSELIAAQREDTGLSDLLTAVQPKEHIDLLQDDVLMCKWLPFSGEELASSVYQVVVQSKFRDLVLKTAHGELSGHLGVRKTYDRVMRHFYWPCVRKDVAHFIKTCHTCQLTGKPNQIIKPAPLYSIPSVGKPFEQLIVDCVGPLTPSKSGSVYLLTVMCQCTLYPAAYPLRSITTKSVVKALSQFISIFGIPKNIQTDRGSNFTSRMFKEVLSQLGVAHQQSSAYHAQSQGASLLRAYCTELSRDWEEGLPWLLLAARKVTQESTGFSPNDLVFGHEVRGPLAVLQGNLGNSEPPSNLIDYISGFRRKFFLAGRMASENLAKA